MHTDEFNDNQEPTEAELKAADDAERRAYAERDAKERIEAAERVTTTFRAFLAKHPAARSVTGRAFHTDWPREHGDGLSARWAATLDFFVNGLVYTYAESDGTITREGRGRDVAETPALRDMFDAFCDMVDSDVMPGDVWLAAGGEDETFTVSRGAEQ